MRGSWPVVGLVALLVVGCMPTPAPRTTMPLEPQTELERAAAAAGASSWRDAELKTPETVCRLLELRVAYPLTIEDYTRTCPLKSWACLGWRELAPVAFMSPVLQPAAVAHAALHEWLHAAVYCYRRGPWPDAYDAAHADEAVCKGGPDSVEQRAQRALELLEAGPDP